MSIATCLAYCSGVRPNRFASATCVCVNLIFLGAVLRVAGATTLDCRFGCSALHQHPRNYRGIFVAYENQFLVVFTLWGLIPILTSFVCNPSAKLVISSSCPNHVLDAAQLVCSLIDGCWSCNLFFSSCLYRSSHPLVKQVVLELLTYQPLSWRWLTSLVLLLAYPHPLLRMLVYKHV